MQIKVFFANKTRLVLDEPPYEVSRNRFVLSNSNLPQAVLALYFHGPDLNEQKYFGDMSIYDGFRGYSKFELSDGLAHVYLTGSCKHMQFPISIAQMLYTNLKQFPEIKAVKIYDENGQTEYPDSEGDSAPTCLNPLRIPGSDTGTPPAKTSTP